MKAWAYSLIKAFELCPRKYYETRVKKRVVEPETEQILYGVALHKALEDNTKTGAPIPEKFDFVAPVAETLRKVQGKHYAELKMGVNRNLQAVDFFAGDVWGRGAADLVVVNGPKALIVDYKSGSDRYPDKDQLKFMSLFVFARFPEVEIAKSSLMFVTKGSITKHKMCRSEAAAEWQKIELRVGQMEQAHESGNYHPTQNFTCRKHCPVKDCEFNGG